MISRKLFRMILSTLGDDAGGVFHLGTIHAGWFYRLKRFI